MKMRDIERLRGDAKPATHLARYEAAFETGAKRVLDRWCPYCGARDREQCFDRNRQISQAVIEIDDNLDERRARAGFAAVLMFAAFKRDNLATLLFSSASREVRRSVAYRFLAHEAHRPPPLFAEKILVETLRRRDVG